MSKMYRNTNSKSNNDPGWPLLGCYNFIYGAHIAPWSLLPKVADKYWSNKLVSMRLKWLL